MFKLRNFKILLLLMLFAFAGQSAWAENYSWFNFDVYVKARIKTADGLVYDNPETGTVYAKLSCNSAEKEAHEYAHTHPSSSSNVQSFSLDATLHAIPNAGFKFLYWTNEDGSIISASETEQNDGKATVACNATLRCFYGEKGTSDPNHVASHNSLIEQYGTYSNIFNYYAVFEPILASIAVKSNNTNIGRAICSKYDNKKDDVVTIKAYCIDYDTKFLGWEVNGEIVSRENPYTFTVTNEANNADETIIYTAVFENGYNFHRIRNYVTKNYLNAISDDGNTSTLVSGGPITSLELNTNDLNDVMYEAGSIVDIYYARIPNDTRYYYDYFVQGAKASRYYDFDPDDPTSSTGGVFLRMPFDAKTYTNTWAFATANEGGFRFTDDNGTPKITMGERPESQWYIECVDKDLNTKENYFSLDPNKLVEVDGKYYTTLRTSWNILFNPDQMTPYVVTEVDEENGTFDMEPITGNIIPAGTPVIIETKSNVVLENRMVPTLTNATNGAVPSGNLLQVSTKYFPNQSAPVSNCKGLYRNANGQLAFGGDALTTVNGNEAYLSVANEVVLPKPIHTVTLAELVAKGEVGETYEITDLTGVDVVDHDQLLICKDNNGYANKDENTENYIDYMRMGSISGLSQEPLANYDQSNWIGLRIPDGKKFTGLVLGNRLSGVVGRLTDAVNPELQLTQVPGTSDDEAAPTDKNLFIAPAFYGVNHQTGKNDKEYFFVQPKPMELANVEMAQWDGSKFIAPVHDEAHPTWNTAELSGEFEFNGSYMSNVDMSYLQTGHIYKLLPAVVKLKTGDFDHVYVLGNVNGLNTGDWNPNKGVEMWTRDGNIYTATLTVNDADNGAGYFSFTKKLGASWTDINAYRFGADTESMEYAGNYPVSESDLDTELPMRADWSDGTRPFKLSSGTYRLTVNLRTMKLIVSKTKVTASGRDGSRQYVVYPLALEKVTSEEGGVITGLRDLTNPEVIGTDYYNTTGMRSSHPWPGVNIVVTRYSDGSRSAVKVVK